MVRRPHDVRLRTPSFLGGGPRPVLVERRDQEFLEGLFRDLLRPDRRDLLQQLAPELKNGVPMLFQPVHRVFNLVLVEAHCFEGFEAPLDPARIESAGVVLRRLPEEAGGDVGRWVHEGSAVRGWHWSADDEVLEEDPDAERRQAARSGSGAIDDALRRRQAPFDALSEPVTPLFPVPPEVCDAVGATLLVGVLSVTSSEISEPAPAGAPPRELPGRFEYSDTDLRTQLADWLKVRTQPRAVPWAGQWLTRQAVATPSNLSSEQRKYLQMLQQVVIQFDLFGESPEATAMQDALRPVRLPFPGGSDIDAVTHLEQATGVLVRGETGVFRMPLEWPPLSSTRADAIREAAREALGLRADRMTPGEAKFGEVSATYQARAFVRVMHDPDCPPRLVWTEPTEPFRIAPWFRGSPVPAPPIDLPDPFDPDTLDALTPNVSFKVPAKLFNFLRDNVPEDVFKGEASEPGQGEVIWFCGFNIPIITIVAFILLFLILNLLNIIFWWLPIVKICIPIPSRN